jgi:hypothetical protein
MTAQAAQAAPSGTLQRQAPTPHLRRDTIWIASALFVPPALRLRQHTPIPPGNVHLRRPCGCLSVTIHLGEEQQISLITSHLKRNVGQSRSQFPECQENMI